MIAAAAEPFADVALPAAVMPSDDVSLIAAARLFDGAQATVVPFDDLMPLTAAVVEVVVFVDPVETWALLFLVCLS